MVIALRQWPDREPHPAEAALVNEIDFEAASDVMMAFRPRYFGKLRANPDLRGFRRFAVSGYVFRLDRGVGR
jgi:hypothetical protein